MEKKDKGPAPGKGLMTGEGRRQSTQETEEEIVGGHKDPTENILQRDIPRRKGAETVKEMTKTGKEEKAKENEAESERTENKDIYVTYADLQILYYIQLRVKDFL